MRAMHTTVLAVLVSSSACLPPDDRPPPGSVLVTASPSDAVLLGAQTEDGWSLTFSKAIVSMGSVGLDDTCATYSEPRYNRVLNLLSGKAQKLVVQYALGQCDLRFSVTPPGANAVLGDGATAADKTLMRTEGSDAYVQKAGISLWVEGSAARNGQRKSFQWMFRESFRYSRCRLESERGVTLQSDGSLVYDITLWLERLFNDDIDDTTAVLRFDPFAGADTDLDGVITFEELAGVPLETIRGPGPYRTGLGGWVGGVDGGLSEAGIGWGEGGLHEGGLGTVDGGGGAPFSLADYLHLVLLPTLARFRVTGTCELNVDEGRNGPMH